MNGSWSGPSMASAVPPQQQQQTKATTSSESKTAVEDDSEQKNISFPTGSGEAGEDDVLEDKYNALIIDSGAIIKHTGFTTLHNAAEKYYTTQGVYNEIRDSKARFHLENLPFQLEIREPSREGLSKVADFSRKTGDYASLSVVDLQVLGLLYDLEKEGCQSVSHVRLEPKHMLGAGNTTFINKPMSSSSQAKDSKENNDGTTPESQSTNTSSEANPSTSKSFFEGPSILNEQKQEEEEKNKNDTTTNTQEHSAPVKKSWATLVNPTAAAKSSSLSISSPPLSTLANHKVDEDESKESSSDDIAEMAMTSTFGSMNLTNNSEKKVTFEESKEEPYVDGQFSDAEDDESIDIPGLNQNDDDDSVEYGSDDDISDEECDVYILDPEEVEAKKQEGEQTKVVADTTATTSEEVVEEELNMDFPSLSASSTVPYDGSDAEEDERLSSEETIRRKKEEEERKKQESLKPVSKHGKVYNSFRGYKNVVSSGGAAAARANDDKSKDEETPNANLPTADLNQDPSPPQRDNQQSRVMGGVGITGQGTEVDDDGEGWITSSKEIASMKAAGTLDITGKSNNTGDKKAKENSNLPPTNARAACATTDFAMQNVILQMNLELLSVDGRKVRKLKSWVTRCSACFKVYTGSENNGKRLFCSECGSDRLQRVAASVNARTGRLKLHLKKDYKHNLRGTKFNLPKPGKGDRFKGDLLLREDQLMFGQWNHTLKKGSKNRDKQSIFGSDIASSVGCHMDLTKRDDIRAGFGRKNPNASKFGRERRGKKKKGATEKACGLRRY